MRWKSLNTRRYSFPSSEKPKTCASTTSSVLSRQFQGKRVALVAGAPCSSNQGFCDMFQLCRLLDADGPIARLKNSFLHLNDYEDLADWMKVSLGGGHMIDNRSIDQEIKTNKRSKGSEKSGGLEINGLTI